MKPYTLKENRIVAVGIIIDELRATGEFRSVERGVDNTIIKFQPNDEGVKAHIQYIFEALKPNNQ